MICDKCRELLPDFLTGELAPKDKAGFEAHLASCEACAEELRRVTATWTRLGVLPTEAPSPVLRDRFYTMLEGYREALEGREAKAAPARRPARLSLFGPWRPAFKFAAAAVLLLAGVGGGIVLGPAGPFGGRIARLQAEMDGLRQSAALTLLRQPSSSERILGVSYSENVRTPAPTTIEALLRTLDQDPSVNVRLAAADALYLFAKDPAVREAVVLSLARQTSPAVQVALIDLLVDLRELRAAEAFKVLVGNEKLDPGVRQRAEQGLRRLAS